MPAIASTLFTAVVTFIATNIDDIFILMVFFSSVDARFRRRHVVIGQYLGFVALVAISLPGFFGSLFIPQEWIGLLGLAPIYLGIRKWLDRQDDQPAAQTALPATSSPALLSSLFHPKTYGVAAVTFANGGDNLGIYTPLFASQSASQLAITLAVFLILVAVWCLLGYRLARHPGVAYAMFRYGHVLVPFVMVGLGVFIILENGTLELFGL